MEREENRAERDRLINEAAALARHVLQTADEAAEKKHQEVRDLEGRWHLSREVPVSLLAVVILQTIALVFWIGQLSSTVNNLVSLQAEFKAERYTREDARRDRDLQDQKMATQKLIDEGFQRNLNSIDARLERLERGK